MAKVTKLSTKRSHLDAMLGVLTSLRQQELYTNVTLICGEKEVKAHRLVLHASSPYFQKIFEEQDPDQREPRIEIDDVDPEVIVDVIHFLYTGELVKTNSLSVFASLKSILDAAYILELPSLRDYCWKDLSKLLTFDFFKDLWNTAELYSNEELANQIITLLGKNFFNASRTRDFLGLKGEQLSKLLQCAESDSSTSDWMLNGILQWVKHDEAERQSLIIELLPFVEVELLSSNYLAHVLNSETLVTDNREQFEKLFAVATSRLMDIDTKPDITKLQPASGAPIPAERMPRKQAVVQPPSIPVVELTDSVETKHADLMEYLDDKLLACTGKETGHDILFMYEFKKKAWAPARALPFSVASGTAVVSICGFIYYVGGDDGSNEGSYIVNKYHPATDTGSEAADLEVAVTQAGAAATHDKIYVVGGISSHAVTKRTQRYDPEIDEWVCVASTMNPHGLPNVLVLYDELYVVGSYNCCVVETYDSNMDQWTVITEIPLPLKEKWPRATAHQDRLWLWKDLEEQKFHVYDVFLNEWEEKLFKGGPKTVYGMWSTCSTLEHLEFVVVSAPGQTYYAYHSESEWWLPLPSLPGNQSCYYWQTVLV